jgi:hypothetical protein
MSLDLGHELLDLIASGGGDEDTYVGIVKYPLDGVGNGDDGTFEVPAWE